MFDGKESVTEFIIHLHFPSPSNPDQNSQKTKNIVLKHHVDYKFQPGENFKDSNEDIELLKTYSVY